MDDVGEILKDKREQKNYTLFDVSKELKISIEILKNLENNYLQKDISSVFIIGHLRSYCLFLDLNHIEIIKQFKNKYLPQDNKNIEIERPKFEYKFLFSNKLISFSLILGTLGVFYFLFIEVDQPSREYAIIPDLPENYNSIIEKANLDSLTTNNKTDNKPKEIFKKVQKIPNSSSAIASPSSIEDDKSGIITLKFLDDTWVQLRDKNDEIIFSQLMNKNDEYSYDLYSDYSITSGNAGHILVLIDQKVRGKVGKKGQVVDSLVISKDFNN